MVAVVLHQEKCDDLTFSRLRRLTLSFLKAESQHFLCTVKSRSSTPVVQSSLLDRPSGKISL